MMHEQVLGSFLHRKKHPTALENSWQPGQKVREFLCPVSDLLPETRLQYVYKEGVNDEPVHTTRPG